MYNFDQEVWDLHRKLFHRLAKYRRYLQAATEQLPQYMDDDSGAFASPAAASSSSKMTNTPSPHVICLLSSDSDAVSDPETDHDDGGWVVDA